MKKFMVIYYAPVAAVEQMQHASPEEMKAVMEPWMAWIAECGEGLVDMGAPLGGGQNVSKSGSSPSNKDVIGYSILQAEDMEGAKALLAGHPHLEMPGGCEIEVHEAMPMPM
ncbi:MAG: hypothetical protein O7E55_10710 [Chloroflexi bacterium]|nr:hypothetical protein [Chloroflexota bacterium]